MIRIFNRFLTFLFSIIIFISCIENSDEYIEENNQQNYISPYKGIWSGTFTGGINGNIKIQVSKNGIVEITKTSNFDSETFYGVILHNGSFQKTNSVSSGFQIMGSLSSKNNIAEGVWNQNSLSGNWKVQKQ